MENNPLFFDEPTEFVIRTTGLRTFDRGQIIVFAVSAMLIMRPLTPRHWFARGLHHCANYAANYITFCPSELTDSRVASLAVIAQKWSHSAISTVTVVSDICRQAIFTLPILCLVRRAQQFRASSRVFNNFPFFYQYLHR